MTKPVSPSERISRTKSAQQQLTANAHNLISKYIDISVQKRVAQYHGNFDKQKEILKNYFEATHPDLLNLFRASYDAEIRYFIKQIEERFPDIVKQAMIKAGIGVGERKEEIDEIESDEKPEAVKNQQLYIQAARKKAYEERKLIREYTDQQVKKEAQRRGLEYDNLTADKRVEIKKDLGLAGTTAELAILAREGKLDVPENMDLKEGKKI